ncbi:hypothetical protein C772_00279 [Bhargavaea cecembensis DSE10]|uniref:SEC-C motif-containing protein n=1 Tax=Bhargavaea cecembensis DSE10 TaxID=1235279 RepID=M7P243_9BACL|nr:SEC-C metal-binding domain-containing protein [Bhargavaea cecembensis]EMR07950.1 hypothetical protein C772_00279 [Bhargavaea cecembensis DSE10]
MAERIGRNDPCPCGSGKKYKKCHGLLNQTNIEQLIDEELNQVIGQFYTRVPIPAHVKANAQLFTEWERRLSPFYDRETIHSQAVDYMYLLQAPEYWQSHVRQSSEKSSRPAVKDVLSSWGSPISIFGKVESISESVAYLRDVLGGGNYTLQLPDDMDLSIGEAVFGHFLQDNRLEDRIMLMNGLVFLESGNPDVISAAEWLREKKSHLDQREFLKLYALDLYEMIGRDESVFPAASVAEEKGQTDKGVEDEGSDVLSLLGQFLSENEVESSGLEEKTGYFLQQVNPKARKPEGVAAGAIRYGQMAGLLEDLDIPKTRIAEHFDVSPSTVQKYADDMMKFHEEKAKV